MPEDAGTKVCPLCAETIKAAAKVCPFCRHNQKPPPTTKQIVLALLSGIALLAIILEIASLIPDDSLAPKGRNFARHRDELLVTRVDATPTSHPKMPLPVPVPSTNASNHSKPPGAPSMQYYQVTGFVTNKGVEPWIVHDFEVSLSDATGMVIDVQHCQVLESFVVQPHNEHAFSFELRSSLTNVKPRPIVRVEAALDANHNQ